MLAIGCCCFCTVQPTRKISHLSLHALFRSLLQRAKITEGVRMHLEKKIPLPPARAAARDRKSTRLNSSHRTISYAVCCVKKKRSPLWESVLSPNDVLSPITTPTYGTLASIF